MHMVTVTLTGESYVQRQHRQRTYGAMLARLVAMRDGTYHVPEVCWENVNDIARLLITLCIRAAEKEAAT